MAGGDWCELKWLACPNPLLYDREGSGPSPKSGALSILPRVAASNPASKTLTMMVILPSISCHVHRGGLKPGELI